MTQHTHHNSDRDSWRRAAKVAAWCLLAPLLLIVLILGGATLWLTPERLSRIVGEQASLRMEADVAVHNMRFTFWSTFPHLSIEADSIRVVSRSLRGLPAAQREKLGPDCDFLASCGHMQGSIDIAALIGNRVELGDVAVDSLRLNLVALSDSVANFYIIPKDADFSPELPYISARRVALTNPRPITYRNVSNGTAGEARLAEVSILRDPHRTDLYRLAAGGEVDLGVGRLDVLRHFPFLLDGKVGVLFNPLRLKLTDYSLSLGNAEGHLDLSADFSSDTRVNTLAFTLDSFSLMRLLGYVPAALPVLSGIDADIDLQASARITSPWTPSAAGLPSLALDITVPEGTVSYTETRGRSYRLRLDSVAARLDFDGRNPERSRLTVASCHASGEGVDLNLTGRVTRLTDIPKVEADMQLRASLERLGRILPIEGCRLGGNVSGTAHMAFSYNEGKADPLEDLTLSSHLDAGRLSAVIAVTDREPVRLVARGGTLDMALGGKTPRARAVATLRGVEARMPADSLSMSAGTVMLSATAPVGLHPESHLTSRLAIDKVRLSHPRAEGSLKGMSLAVATSPRSAGATHSDMPAPMPDSSLLAAIPHTPVSLSASCPEAMKRFMRSVDLRARFRAEGGDLLSEAFPTANRIYDVDIELEPDTLRVNRLSLRAGDAGMRLAGYAAGVHDFLSIGGAQPLAIDMDVALDTVNINRLAYIYEQGAALLHGQESLEPHMAPPSPSDSVTILLPRNLTANIRATAKETVYTDLHLYNLAAAVKMAGGDARVERLDVATDFGKAGASLAYFTGDASRLHAEAKVDVDSVDVVRFFRNFHTLLEMMPQMSNLKGYVSAQAGAGVDLFPDMCANVPSLVASVGVEGRGLTVHQSRFIRRVTRMMMIHTDRDLHIADMNVHASVHDNLLELDPFNFEFDSYKLKMEGLNNFNGELYYHVGVLKSPLHIPFGINITGAYSHPKLRFGGPKFKTDQTERITTGIATGKSVNIVREARYFLKEFVHKAAQSAVHTGTPAPLPPAVMESVAQN